MSFHALCTYNRIKSKIYSMIIRNVSQHACIYVTLIIRKITCTCACVYTSLINTSNIYNTYNKQLFPLLSIDPAHYFPTRIFFFFPSTLHANYPSNRHDRRVPCIASARSSLVGTVKVACIIYGAFITRRCTVKI